jgi:uncharacterized protein (DUF488 family)
MSSPTLYTIGYQGHTIESFLELLHAHHIEQVLDIRRRPYSRKPGFSRRRLSEALHEANIAYNHLVDLGTPPPLLDDVRATRDYDAFFREFERYLQSQPEAITEALRHAQQRRSALLCLEALPNQCHRSSVASILARQADGALMIEHL